GRHGNRAESAGRELLLQLDLSPIALALAKLFSASTNRQRRALLLASSLIQPRRNSPTGVFLRAFWTLIVTLRDLIPRTMGSAERAVEPRNRLRKLRPSGKTSVSSMKLCSIPA